MGYAARAMLQASYLLQHLQAARAGRLQLGATGAPAGEM